MSENGPSATTDHKITNTDYFTYCHLCPVTSKSIIYYIFMNTSYELKLSTSVNSN